MPVKFVPMKNSRLCSKHFSADMFEKGYSQRPVLKPNAVPTIFNDCFGQVGCDIGLFQLLPATHSPGISANFHVKFTPSHGISM